MNILTYIINLKKREDRKEHILKEFSGRSEFSIQIIEAIEQPIGAVGLWQTIIQILKQVPEDAPFILLCEDDHQFTVDYSYEKLCDGIEKASAMEADILLGGPSWFNNIFQVSDHLYWVESFTGLQFTIIFKKYFPSILGAVFEYSDAADLKISELPGIYTFLYPFASIQKEFGYSDATKKNETKGKIASLYSTATEKVKLINQVTGYYKNNPTETPSLTERDYEEFCIPVYIINLPERTDRLANIKKEFEARKEFDIKIVPACKHEIGAVGLWESIKGIVRTAVENDDDVIIICEDDHEFTSAYSKRDSLENIIESHYQGADVLVGGVESFSQIIPLTDNRFWIDSFRATQFITVFKKCFHRILAEEYDEKVTADGMLSEITSNKMVIYPFISVKKDFGYSDIRLRNDFNNDVFKFDNSEKRISKTLFMYKKHGNS